MACHIRQFFARLLLGVLVLALLLGFLSLPSAAIQQLEEAPGQWVYQSRQTLQDEQGHHWQVIAFQRVQPDGRANFWLRLVGFPGVVEIDHAQPLSITTSLGQTLTAPDVSSQVFTDAASLEPNVGQYDLLSVLPHLKAEIPVQLKLATTEVTAVMHIPTSVVQEWQKIAAHPAAIGK